MLEIFNMVLNGWELLLKKIAGVLSIRNLSYIIPFSIAAVLVLRLTVGRMIYVRKKLQFKVKKNNRSRLSRVTERLLEYNITNRVLNSLAVRVSMFTEYSYRGNVEIACAGLLASSAALTATLVIVFIKTSLAWYMVLVYTAILLAFALIIFYVFTRAARMRFTGKLPQTFKLLNSRYISKGNILKAIFISMDDFDGSVKREMRKIYDVLKKNQMVEIDLTFKQIEATYDNEYLTLLLALIKHAHYKGGNEVIKQQFEQATEEVLLEIENHRDLSVTTRAYILLALFTPLFMFGIQRFNQSALGSKAVEFYRSPYGLEMLVLFLLALVAFIAYMLFLERTA